MHTQEEVFSLACIDCNTTLSSFGYMSVLLSDQCANVYSTNFFSDKVKCVYEPYTSKKCRCAIRDVACSFCGLIVGYHVEQPCKRCLEDENNGHMWMFSEKRIRVSNPGKLDKRKSLLFMRVCAGRSTACWFLEPER